MRVDPDVFWRPDVQVQFATDDAAVILPHHTGLVEQTDAFIVAPSSRDQIWPKAERLV